MQAKFDHWAWGLVSEGVLHRSQPGLVDKQTIRVTPLHVRMASLWYTKPEYITIVEHQTFSNHSEHNQRGSDSTIWAGQKDYRVLATHPNKKGGALVPLAKWTAWVDRSRAKGTKSEIRVKVKSSSYIIVEPSLTDAKLGVRAL